MSSQKAEIDWRKLIRDPILQRTAFYITLFVALEIVQNNKNQPTRLFLRDVFSFPLAIIFLVQAPMSMLWMFLLVTYQVAETCSFIFLQRTMDDFFFMLLNPLYPFKDGHWRLIIFAVVPCVAVIVAVVIPPLLCRSPPDTENRQMDHCLYLFFAAAISIQIVGWTHISKGLHPKMEPTCGTVPEIMKLHSYITTPLKAALRPGATVKNVIEIVCESFDQQLMGEFNEKGLTKALPFVTSLAKQGTLCTNTIMGPYTDWSIAGLFATHCGLPMMCMPGGQNRAPILNSMGKLKCFGDILKQVGYNRWAIYTGDGAYGGFKALLMNHGFDPFKDRIYGVHIDKDLLRQVRQDLPGLMRDYKEKGVPFALLLGLEDTHPMFRIECKPRTSVSGTERIMESFDCMDQYMEELWSILKDNGVTRDNTVIVIHGDHNVILQFPNVLVGERMHRRLSVMFPFSPQRRINKTTTIYDIAPTVLEELGIDYEPHFPLGNPVTDPTPGKHPKESTMDFLWDYFRLR